MGKELTLDEKLVAAGITVPAETTQEVKELLLAQSDKTAELEAEKAKIAKDAGEAIKKAQAAVSTAKTAAVGHGSFKNGDSTYDIVLASIELKNEETGSFYAVTAEELKADKELQALFIKEKYGMIKLKVAK